MGESKGTQILYSEIHVQIISVMLLLPRAYVKLFINVTALILKIIINLHILESLL